MQISMLDLKHEYEYMEDDIDAAIAKIDTEKLRFCLTIQLLNNYVSK